MSSTGSATSASVEIEERPNAVSTTQAGSLELLDDDPILGAIVAGVIAGLIVAAVTNPSTTAQIVNDAIDFVADAYESYGETCVNSPGSC